MDTADPVAKPARASEGAPPHRRFTDRHPSVSNAVGSGMLIEGAMRGAAGLEVLGRFIGELTIDGLLRIGPGGRVEGTVEVVDLIVEGELLGAIRATGTVDLRSGCRVEAEIEAARVVAAEGSHIEGRITVTGSAESVISYSERRRRR
jgi:cytoskeletal protein CcmA (bactofilin family)